MIQSGRALVYPIYKSQYERGDGLEYDDPDETVRLPGPRDLLGKGSGEDDRLPGNSQRPEAGQAGVLRFEHGSLLGEYFSRAGKHTRIKVAVLLSGGFDFAKKLRK